MNMLDCWFLHLDDTSLHAEAPCCLDSYRQFKGKITQTAELNRFRSVNWITLSCLGWIFPLMKKFFKVTTE